jgi:hypothetical protein
MQIDGPNSNRDGVLPAYFTRHPSYVDVDIDAKRTQCSEGHGAVHVLDLVMEAPGS